MKLLLSGLNFDGPELSYRLPKKELESRENAEKNEIIKLYQMERARVNKYVHNLYNAMYMHK
jgi:hypothetical protein